jgi:glutamyl-tRNA reductase
MKVIIVNGAARNGKDNFVIYFKKNYKYKCINWSTIDKVKKVSKRNFGWKGEKTNEARKFLSEIKRIWGEYNNGPFMNMVDRISEHYSKLDKKERKNFIYFVHCREPYEIQKFVDKYKNNCITILLKREDREVPDNDADKNVANFNYDYIIDNNGIKKDLEKEAIKFIEIIKKASN